MVSRSGPPPEQRPVSRIYRVNLESSLSGWVGATAAALQPLVDALATHVVASDTLHVDDTGVPVLAPGTGQDQDRAAVDSCAPFVGARPPAALFCYSPDRKGEHPRVHLNDFCDVIHADGYAGFNKLFAAGRIVEAGFWAHAPRRFFDVHAATGSPVAKESTRPHRSAPIEMRSTDHRPSGEDNNGSSSQRQLPRHWPLGLTTPCANSRANPSSPKPSAICGRAGPRWCAVSMTAIWLSTTIPPSAACAASR